MNSTTAARDHHHLLRTLAVLAAVSLGLIAACGDDGGSSDDSSNGLTSNSTSNGTTGGTTGGGTTGGLTSNAPVVETDFPIAFTALNRSEVPGIDPGGNLMIMHSDGSEEVQVNPDAIQCDSRCVISGDRQWFVWQSNDGTGTVRAAAITEISYDGVTVDNNNAVTIDTDVRTWSVAGDRIAWVTGEFEAVTATLPADSGSVSLGSLGQADRTTGGVYLGPNGRYAVTWTLPGLTAMELTLHDLEANTSIESFYTFRSDGTGGTGSFYGSRERMAVSPDGRYLAVATRGLTDTTPCSDDTQCLTTEQCGVAGRCTSQRLTINMIDFNDVDKLDGACTSDAECGASHFCDFANPADPNSGRCLAGRLDLGAAGPQGCSSRQDGEFTEVRDTMAWSPDSTTLYYLAAEDCSRFNIPRAGIFATSPTFDSVTPVLENPGQDWDGTACYDDVEMEFVVGSADCVLDIVEFNLAPTGNTIVFSASSPKAATNYELYTIDSRGQRDKEWLTDSLETIVQSLNPLEDL